MIGRQVTAVVVLAVVSGVFAGLTGVLPTARVSFAAIFAAGSRQQTLSYERYRETIEPVFLADRGGYGPGRAACVTCHAGQGTPLRLQALQEGENGDVSWSETQSRQNFEVVARLIEPGRPELSRLLSKALAVSEGGASFHVGGKFFESREDPEWQAMADWVRAADVLPDAVETAAPELDFDFFQDCVQRIFLDKRPHHMECVHCHGSGLRGFAQTLADDREYWNEEESRGNFLLVKRYVEPGFPLQSRFLTHPLAPAEGGDHFHGGGRRWVSQEDPEWQMLAAWVRVEPTGCLDY